MSNLGAIGLILSLTLAATYITFYVTRCTQTRSDRISMGTAAGVSISAEARLAALFQEYLPAVFAIAVFEFIVAVGMVQIAANVTDADIKVLAWMGAVLAGFGCLGWLFGGGVFFFSWWGILRQAEAD
jgi:hypothetical protein